MIPLAEIVDGEALADVLWASVLAGVGVTASYSIALAGAALFAEARREGRSGRALAMGAVTGIAGALFIGAVVVGVIVMTNK